MYRLNLNKILVILGVIAVIMVAVFLTWFYKRDITISNKQEAKKSVITGLECENATRRPVAVMLAGDKEARPLSAISQADLVVEMLAAPNGITRFMAVYQCEEPKEIGSVRSARDGFTDLAGSFDAIFAHWGGERGALERLDGHVIDNIDAMKYEGTTYYRKKGIRQPHNGFTSFELLWGKAKELKYRLDNKFAGYPHKEGAGAKNLANLVDNIKINYPDPFGSEWKYDTKTNDYARYRDGKKETDASGGEGRAGVVIVMKTISAPLRDQYVDVEVYGEGEAQIYQNEISISGKWKKDRTSISSKLYFYDFSGKEIEFAPGKIWIEIVAM